MSSVLFSLLIFLRVTSETKIAKVPPLQRSFFVRLGIWIVFYLQNKHGMGIASIQKLSKGKVSESILPHLSIISCLLNPLLLATACIMQPI